jgi:hypothetical protein
MFQDGRGRACAGFAMAVLLNDLRKINRFMNMYIGSRIAFTWNILRGRSSIKSV